MARRETEKKTLISSISGRAAADWTFSFRDSFRGTYIIRPPAIGMELGLVRGWLVDNSIILLLGYDDVMFFFIFRLSCFAGRVAALMHAWLNL